MVVLCEVVVNVEVEGLEEDREVGHHQQRRLPAFEVDNFGKAFGRHLFSVKQHKDYFTMVLI